MNQKRIPFTLYIHRVARAAVTYTIRTPPIAAGQILVIDWVGATNLDTNNVLLDVGLRLGVTDLWLYTIVRALKGIYYGHRLNVTMYSEQQLVFRVRDPTAGDRSIINVVGHYLEDQE